MSISNGFSTIDKAIIEAIGNSLVVCGDAIEPVNNTGAMIKADGTTTRDWTQNGSSATINIATHSMILYAELIWYSTVTNNKFGGPDLYSIQNQAINFTTPNETLSIEPDRTEEYMEYSDEPNLTIHTFRTKNVTTILQELFDDQKVPMSGTFTVSGVPTSIPTSGNSNSRSGWTLIVVYKNESFTAKKIDVNTGINIINYLSPMSGLATGFITPTGTTLTGRVLWNVANASPLLTGDSYFIGKTFATLQNAGNSVGTGNPNPGTTPNNPYNNVFAGQINNADPLSTNVGKLNTTGTLGTQNHDAFLPAQYVGARNKWDISSFNVANMLSGNQNQLAFQVNTGDNEEQVEVLFTGWQIDVSAANITSNFEVDKAYAEVGQNLTYSTHLTNIGNEVANNLTIHRNMRTGVNFVPGSIMINGVNYPNANIVTGVNLGSLAKNESISCCYEAQITAVPNPKILEWDMDYSYDFTSGVGSPTYYNKDESNYAYTEINEGKLTLVKSADVEQAEIGDVITFTVNLTNEGTVNVSNIFFQDIVGNTCIFNYGSVKINGTTYVNYNPNLGFTIPTIVPDETVTVEFKTTFQSIPYTDLVSNNAVATYTYQIPLGKVITRTSATSNTVSILVLYSRIYKYRSLSNYYPLVGDIITYTLNVTNTGTIAALNTSIIEPPVEGSTFVTGSVTINGQSYVDYNPFDGFIIPTINPDQTVVVTYRMNVVTISTEEIVVNMAQIPYEYQLEPGGPVIYTEKDSNQVKTRFNYVTINLQKSASLTYATINDIIHYTTVITTVGNIPAVNTIFQDILQENLQFVAGTVKINDVLYTSYDPVVGFTLGEVAPDNVMTVEFDALVISVPLPNIVNNKSKFTYDYIPNPLGVHITDTRESNTVITYIDKGSATIVKSANVNYAQLYDTITYTTIVTNTGNVPLENMFFGDNIPSQASFVAGTVSIDGVVYPDYDPQLGFTLPDLQPSGYYTILFNVHVDTLPPASRLFNSSQITYHYHIDPAGLYYTVTQFSQQITTYIVNPSMTFTKSVSKSYALVNDVLTYSFQLFNTGNSNNRDLFFQDILSGGATFIADSVIINGTSQPGLNPITGFSLGNLNIGKVITLSFQARITALPTPPTITNFAKLDYVYKVDPTQADYSTTITTNTVTTHVVYHSVTSTKSVDYTYATIGDTLTYNIIVNNLSNVSISNTMFQDLIPQGADFIAGTVKINNIVKAEYNPELGFTLGTIAAETFVSIEFKAIVTNLPTSNPISNTATTEYTYRVNPSGPDIEASVTSNAATTYIYKAILTNTKSVNKGYAALAEELTFTSLIRNTGNINSTTVFFTDVLQQDLSFVPNSVTIDGTSQPTFNPNTGFSLGTITPDQTVTVVFRAIVSTLPANAIVYNTSNVTYDYLVNPTQPVIHANTTSNTTSTFIRVANLYASKVANYTYATLDDIITYTFQVRNQGTTSLLSVQFTDVLQAESTFEAGTVKINNQSYPEYNPVTGFTLGDLAVSQVLTITFNVKVTGIPVSGQLTNFGHFAYNYFVDPAQAIKNGTKNTNTSTVYIRATVLTATKTASKSIAKLLDNVRYTFVVKNSGNTDAFNTVFTDLLDTNTSFIADSVVINDVPQPTYDPEQGFPLGIITPAETINIYFDVKVNTLPADNYVENTATIDYQYRVNPGDDPINQSIESNTTTVYVAVGKMDFTKTANKDYITVGELLTYTFVIRNSGSVNLVNQLFTDVIPTYTSFVSGSVTINGTSYSNYNPNNGFALPDLAPTQQTIVVFNTTAMAVPPTGIVTNKADVQYSFKLTPTDPTETYTKSSNTITTHINLGQLTITKSVDKAYATINDLLNYTIVVRNTGNVNATSINFSDLIQPGATFVNDSVLINDVQQPGLNPNTGFQITNLTPNQQVTIKFQSRVTTLPPTYYIDNTAQATYHYYIDPSKEQLTNTAYSNTVTTRINVSVFTASKAVSKSIATIGDLLTYTVTINNAGNVNFFNVNLRDIVPTGTTFVTDSVMIDGIAKPGFNPYTSFPIDTILPGKTCVVKFNVTVTSLPTPSLISNTATITYSYKLNPNNPETIVEYTTNAATTQINVGKLTLTKSVSKTYATVYDTLHYTVIVRNTGNVNATNLYFSDPIVPDLFFGYGSVTIDDVEYPDYNVMDGFPIKNLTPNEYVTVKFDVMVYSLPIDGYVENAAYTSFNYKVDPIGETYSYTQISNTVRTYINVGSIYIILEVDKAYATINDTLHYTATVVNDGTVDAKDVLFQDLIPTGTTFTPGTVYIDGLSKASFDPNTGFTLGTLIPGQSVIVKYNSSVTSLPNPSKISTYATGNYKYKIDPTVADIDSEAWSNTVETQINVGKITPTKSVDLEYALINNKLTYTVVVTNTGNVNATNVQFYDTLQAELNFISGTVTINGVQNPALNPNTGFALGTMTPSQSITVKFDAKVTSLPNPPQIDNKAQVEYSYTIDPNSQVITTTTFSNTVVTHIIVGQLTTTKAVSADYVTLNDVITYTITLNNVGNVTVSDINFLDTPSVGATFKPGTVKINNVSYPTYDPTAGFTIPDMSPGTVYAIKFDATITSIPTSGKVTNFAAIQYKYYLNPMNPKLTVNQSTNLVTTYVNYGNMSVTKFVDKTFATIDSILTYTINVVNTGNINLENVIFTDITPYNTILVLGSVIVNGVAEPTYNPEAGFSLGTLVPQQTVVVVYQVKVVE